jgi:hypothetical protein
MGLESQYLHPRLYFEDSATSQSRFCCYAYFVAILSNCQMVDCSEEIESSIPHTKRMRLVEMTYIQREIRQLAATRFFDVGRQLILPPQRRSFVDKLPFLVITRAWFSKLLATSASRMSFVTLQQHIVNTVGH